MALGLRDEKDIPQDKARKDIPSKRGVRAKPGEYALKMEDLTPRARGEYGGEDRQERADLQVTLGLI